MATHDYVIDNSTGANVRSDLNSVLQAILTNNSSGSAPSVTAAYMLWIDTSANIIKIRNSADNAWINLFTTAGGIDVDAASNFNEDVTFTGAAANVIFDKSDNALEFADNAKAKFGTGEDLQIYHDGTNNYLDTASGELRIRTNSENAIVANTNGSVELWHDGSEKAFTMSTGFNVVGTLTADGIDMEDSHKILLGTGDDLQIYHDGTTSRIHSGSHPISIRSGGQFGVFKGDGSEAMLTAQQDGAVDLYYDNSKKFETTSTGISVAGNINPTGHVALPDNSQLRLGTGDDLKIYHDGSNSYISDTGTGLLTIGGSEVRIEGGSDHGETCAKFIDNGAVELYHDNIKRFETTGAGISVTGHIDLDDNENLRFGSSQDMLMGHGGSSGYIRNDNGEFYLRANGIRIVNQGNDETYIKCIDDGAVELYHDNSKKFETTSTGIGLHGLSTGAGNSDLRYNSSTGQVTYDTSTILVKENIQAVPYGLNIVNQLQPKIYERTDDNNKIELGFIAEEMEKLIPEIVPKIKGLPVNVDYRKVCVVLTKAIQELSAKVAALEVA